MNCSFLVCLSDIALPDLSFHGPTERDFVPRRTGHWLSPANLIQTLPSKGFIAAHTVEATSLGYAISKLILV
jgi:hypothetical protein